MNKLTFQIHFRPPQHLMLSYSYFTIQLGLLLQPYFLGIFLFTIDVILVTLVLPSKLCYLALNAIPGTQKVLNSYDYSLQILLMIILFKFC